MNPTQIRTLATTGFALALMLAGAAALAQTNGIPGPQDYAQFSRFVTDRNIFDPNRQPHSYSPNRPRPRSTTRQRPPGIQFVGTMSYEKGMFAFFSGNSADLSKVTCVGDKIADYIVTGISADSVQLESADKKQQFALRIGDGFRQENGKWVHSEGSAMTAAASEPETAASPSTGSTSATPDAPASTSEPNDVLKRLMEKRAKENQ